MSERALMKTRMRATSHTARTNPNFPLNYIRARRSKSSRNAATKSHEGKDDSRHRTSSSASLVNTRRFSTLHKNSFLINFDESASLKTPKQKQKQKQKVFDPLLSPKFAAFTNDNKTVVLKEPSTDEEFLFVEAYQRNLDKILKNDKKLLQEREKSKIFNRRSSKIAININNTSNSIDVNDFKNESAHDAFLAEENSNLDRDTDVLLSLSPPKSRVGRRATTSHLLVESICKHVTTQFYKISNNPEHVKFVNLEDFSTLLEQMAFLGVDPNGNQVER